MERPQHGPEEVRTEEQVVEDLLVTLGLHHGTIRHARIMARLNGSALEEELLAAGHIEEDQLYAGLADHLGLDFLPVIPVALVTDNPELDNQLRAPHALRLSPKDEAPVTVLVPRLSRLRALGDALASDPQMASRSAVTSPSALREAVWKVGAKRRVAARTGALHVDRPELSARLILHARQAFALGMLAALLVIFLMTQTALALNAVHTVLSFLYAAVVSMRLLAFLPRARKPEPEKIDRLQPGLPVYTVLVALHQEAAVARQLITALSRIEWPHARLDIKLICEEGDRETIAALKAVGLPAYMELVEVPDHLPRTKPKALSYALAGARGALVTVYDAEDRPHPLQLREAHARFLREGSDLACLQAPLEITNGGKNWLSGLFAVEYAALFGSLLPFLARLQLPLPLGGTSNHFRRSALVECGAWDPFNVTEDADLGTRLHRFGYRTGMISYPTREDAPEERAVWIAQRRRWFKGWLQTLLVSFRYPLQLAVQLGPGAMIAYTLTTGGMLLSALFHPMLYLSLGIFLWDAITGTLPVLASLNGLLMVVDAYNLIGGFALMLLAWLLVMPASLPRPAWRRLGLVPLYWLNLTLAAWMALYELYRNPFVWNKTPHSPVRRRQRAAPGENAA